MSTKVSRRAFVAFGAAAALGLGAGIALADAAKKDEAPADEKKAEPQYTSTSGKTLKVICTNESYKKLFDKFTQEVGAPVEFVSMSSGEVLSKLRAEGGTPGADLWFGGGIDSFMGAKKDGLLEAVDFEAAKDFNEGFKDPENCWFSKGVTVVGFIVNHEILDEIGAPAPQSWQDLVKPEYEGEVLMSSPAVSGTNYAVVNALLQNLGEEDGWKYFADLNKNIPFYTKRGSDPSTRVSQGEAAVGITYLDGTLAEILEEGKIELVYPADGMPYVPDGVAAFKGASDTEDAKLFIEWLFSSAENLRFLAEIDKKNTVLLCKPNIEGLELDFDVTQLLKEDLSLFGAQREAVLAKWAEVTAGTETLES